MKIKEPDTGDTATIKIWDADGNLVLSIYNNLDNGNQQAHNNNK
jgi:hypothetical protein